MSAQTRRASRRKYADARFSRLVRIRDKTCRMCGSLGPLDCAHFLPRVIFVTRWDADNALALCRPCHRVFDGVYDKYAFMAIYLGEERYEALLERARVPWDKDYDRVHAELKEWEEA